MLKQRDKSRKVIQKNSYKKVQSTQMNTHIKDIRKGIILTDDDRYVKIIEVLPTIFESQSIEDKLTVIKNFQTALTLLPSSFQIISIALKSDLSRQIERLKDDYAAEENENCKQMDIEYGNRLYISQENSITRRHFIVFEHKGKNDFKTAYKELNRTANDVAQYLYNCGNDVINIKATEDSNYLTAEMLYTIFNKDKKNQETFNEHISLISQKYYEQFNGAPVPITEFFAPDIIEFNDKKIVKINNTYYRYLYVPTTGYPRYTDSTWLMIFTNAAPYVDLTIYAERADRNKKIEELRKKIVYADADNDNAAYNTKSYENSSSNMQSASNLKAGLEHGEDYYDFGILITITGDTPQMVEDSVREVEKSCLNQKITVREVNYNTEAMYKSNLPLGKIDKYIFELSKRNVLTSGLSSCYPFTTSEINDPNGIYIGNDQYSDAIVAPDFGNTHRFTNSNIFICGKTGAGKSFTLMLLAIRMRTKRMPVFILAPEKQVEFQRLCSALGGQFINVAPGSPDRINIMEIFKPDEEAMKEDLIINGNFGRTSLLAQKTTTLLNFFKLTFNGLSEEEKRLLDRTITRTYERFGITNDNNSIYLDESHQSLKKMPILSDLNEDIKKVEKLERIQNLMYYFIEGSGSSFNGETNVQLNNKFTVFGLEYNDDEQLPASIYLAMDFVWSVIKQSKTQRKALIIDEWWKLAKNPVAAEYSMQIAKTIRAYAGSLILATQQMKDILQVDDGKFGESVLNNCNIKIVMGLENKDAKSVQKMLDLTDSELKGIIRYAQGEALFMGGKIHLPIKFVAGERETYLIATDEATLKKYKMNQLKEEEEKKKKEMLEEITDYNDEVILSENEENDDSYDIDYVDDSEIVSNSSDENEIEYIDDDELIDEYDDYLKNLKG